MPTKSPSSLTGSGAAARNTCSMPAADAHVYLLHGEEDLLIDQALAALLVRLVPAEERDLNMDVLRATEIAITDLVTRLDTLPFFGRRRVVVVKDADAWKAPEQERLAAYLEQGTPPSALIPVAQGLDRRRKLYTAIRRVREVQECTRLSVRQLPLWITERARQAGRPLDAGAVDRPGAPGGPG